jgi:hypothetical protein
MDQEFHSKQLRNSKEQLIIIINEFGIPQQWSGILQYQSRIP